MKFEIKIVLKHEIHPGPFPTIFSFLEILKWCQVLWSTYTSFDVGQYLEQRINGI